MLAPALQGGNAGTASSALTYRLWSMRRARPPSQLHAQRPYLASQLVINSGASMPQWQGQQHQQQQLGGSGHRQRLGSGWQQQRRRQQRPLATATASEDYSGGSSELGLGAGGAVGGRLQSRTAAGAAGLHAFFKFTRPHTMLGTFVSVCSISLLAMGPADFGPQALTAFLQAVTSALLMNICIVGINQIYDIEIDRVNKPYLPLAAGDFSVRTGTAIVLVTGAVALVIGLASGSAPLLATLAGSLALGIAYSTDLPFLRWKRWPLVAAGCILAVRSILVQLGFYLHMRGALGAPAGLGAVTRPVAFATAFMLAFSVVIALFKDIPDVQGDSKAGVRTFSVRLGTRRVYWACIAILELAYLGAILVGLSSTQAWSRAAAAGSHAAMAAFLLWRARQTDLSSSKSMYDCYMDVWKLFYAEYLLLPLFR